MPASDDATSLRPVTLHRRSAAATPVLRVVSGARRGESLALDRRELTLGRDPDAELRFTDRGLSRRHAKLIVAGDGLVSVLDLDSTNGTYVNGSRVGLAIVREGDQLQLGPEVVLRLAYEEASAPRPSEPLPLSPRQLEVARLVATGLTSAEIAGRLGLSARTVTSHLDHIYARLAIGSRAALTLALARAGVLPDE